MLGRRPEVNQVIYAMKTPKEDILTTRLGRNDGMTVPDGYFDTFSRRMMASLPERPEIESAKIEFKPRTNWQKLRPYVYLAAMFTGIWCMLKMFTMMGGMGNENSHVDSNPVLADALSSPDFFDDYISTDINQWDLLDEMADEGFDPAALGDDDSMLEFSQDSEIILPADMQDSNN